MTFLRPWNLGGGGGYKVVVPYQEEAWCYHDGVYVYSYKGIEEYYDYYECFVNEYAKIIGCYAEKVQEDFFAMNKKYAHLMSILQNEIEALISECNTEGRKALGKFFQNDVFCGKKCFDEYEAIFNIDQKEESNQSQLRFWEEGMSASQLVLKLRILRHALKRMEYEAGCLAVELIQDNYSEYAIIEICERYIMDKESVFKKLQYI